VTASATDLIGKLGIDRAFRYFANGLVVLLVVFVVMPFPAVSWISEISSGKDDCFNLALLLFVVATGLVSTTLLRTVLGRLFLYRIQEFLPFGKPTIVSELMGEPRVEECWLAKLMYARLRYTAWRRNSQLLLLKLEPECPAGSSAGTRHTSERLRLVWHNETDSNLAIKQQTLRDSWHLGHVEIDLAFLIGVTWLLAATGALFYGVPTSLGTWHHIGIGVLVILAAAIADLRQHEYEYLMATLDPRAVQRPPIKEEGDSAAAR
jgi:hypothetical protein